jgi:hypothetical protein
MKEVEEIEAEEGWGIKSTPRAGLKVLGSADRSNRKPPFLLITESLSPLRTFFPGLPTTFFVIEVSWFLKTFFFSRTCALPFGGPRRGDENGVFPMDGFGCLLECSGVRSSLF